MHQELFLVHFGRFSWSDVQEMSPRERDWFYEQLVDVQKKQAAAIEQAHRPR